MSHKTFVFIALWAITSCQFGCNPDCTSLPGLNISPEINAPGHEILISANPPDVLKNRKVYFGDNQADETEYIEGHGLKVKIPLNLPAGTVNMRIEDPDCADFITLDFNVVSENFFINNTEYVFPPLPEIIIPTLPPASFPVSIENAWLSVNDLDYCLWFRFMKDYEIVNGDTLGFTCTNVIDAENSIEQCFGPCTGRCDGISGENCLYSGNPISGIIDPGSNYIRITIDRTQKGGGYEEFTGVFINPSETGNYQGWEAGTTEPISQVPDLATNKIREHMILLTSLKNGRKLLIYQQGINPNIVAAAKQDCI